MGASAETDLQQPLSALLRAGTKAAHERAEKSTGAAWLLRGELDREEYVRFLMMLWHVYEYVDRFDESK
jgi:heme oxygenase